MKNKNTSVVSKKDRRKLLHLFTVTSGSAVFLPNQWVKPMVNSVVTPAHAETSGGVGPVDPPEPPADPPVLACGAIDVEFLVTENDTQPALMTGSIANSGAGTVGGGAADDFSGCVLTITYDSLDVNSDPGTTSQLTVVVNGINTDGTFSATLPVNAYDAPTQYYIATFGYTVDVQCGSYQTTCSVPVVVDQFID